MSLFGQVSFRKTALQFWGAAVFALAGVLPAQAQGNRYRIQPGELLNVSVYQWPEHSGEARVDIDGSISRPAVGRFPVAGKTLDEVETHLRNELSKWVDLTKSPVVVSVAEYRPVTVLGAVNNPGRHPFQPGLTVLDGLALSGGPLLLASGGDTFDQAVRQSQLQDQVGTTEGEYLAALVHRERLLAEKESRDVLRFSDPLMTLLKENGHEAIAAREIDIFNGRKSALKEQQEEFLHQKKLYEDEITSLADHAREIRNSIVKVDEEYKRLQAVLERGLVRRVDLVTVDNQLTNLQGNLRSTIVADANAKSLVARLESSRVDLARVRQDEVNRDLLEVDKLIKTLENRRVARASIPPTRIEAASETADDLNYVIFRQAADGSVTSVEVSATTPIRPGDIVTVTRPKRIFSLGSVQ
jgi:protein involved in polysaccharide export with SLBB domain